MSARTVFRVTAKLEAALREIEQTWGAGHEGMWYDGQGSWFVSLKLRKQVRSLLGIQHIHGRRVR